MHPGLANIIERNRRTVWPRCKIKNSEMQYSIKHGCITYLIVNKLGYAIHIELVFKIVNGYEDVDRNMFFKHKEGSRTRGHKAALVKEQCRLDMRKYSF